MMNSAGSATRSCFECRRRKIRCDRWLPCSYCAKIKIQCSYPPPRVDQKGNEHSAEEDLGTRITKVEQSLQSLEANLSQLRQILQTQAASSANRSYGGELYQQIHRSDQHGMSPRYALSQALPDPGFEPLHPQVLTISLWQKYLENVDPILKVLHTSSTQRQLMGNTRGQEVASTPTECLKSAIHYAAVVTISVEDCRVEFNQNKSDMVKRYRTEAENCLEKSRLHETSDMTVLQAFIIYLSCSRYDDQALDMKKLIGIATGIAFKIGLHRDGTELSLPPFQIEMRRRLWWQIYILDTLIAEECGENPRILKSWFDTKLPLNVNDASLDPDMRELPESTSGKTEMLFVLMRIKAVNCARGTVFPDQFCSENDDPILSTPQKCAAIDLFMGEMEKQLSGYDHNLALVYFTTSNNRLIQAKLKLAVSKPRIRQEQSFLVTAGFRKICTEILHQAAILRRYEKGRQWLWTFQTSHEWEALTYLLINLSLAPKGEGLDLAWNAVDEIYNHWQNDGISRGNHWDNVDDLRLKALRAREIEERTPGRHSELVQLGPQDLLSRMWDLGNTAVAALAADHSPSHTVIPSQPTETPSSGTGCQWSKTLFERYFQVLDSEHISPL